jgi:DNA-binding Lrp family transcriptional regulator
MSVDLDLDDRRLLHLLGQDASAIASIAQEIGLSTAELERRLHGLIERGVISDVVARIAPDRVGLPITAFYFLRVSQNAEDTEAFDALIRDVDQVEEAHTVSGQYDWLVKVRARSVADVQELLTHKIAVLPGFVRGETMIVLSTASDRVNVDAVLHETD